MNQKSPCSSEVVAQSAFSSITVCPHCNLYHLHIGPMSFRLEGEIFESFCAMIVEHYLNRTSQLTDKLQIAAKH